MTHTSHTPGPWEVRADVAVWTARGPLPLSLPWKLGTFHGDANEELMSEARANARLIAEAPAMLEALRAVLAMVEARTGNTSGELRSGITHHLAPIIARIEGA